MLVQATSDLMRGERRQPACKPGHLRADAAPLAWVCVFFPPEGILCTQLVLVPTDMACSEYYRRFRMGVERSTRSNAGSNMSQDIDAPLKGWDFKPGVVQARLVQATDGRQVIQMRVDLGILQIETTSRPDGTRPHGCPTYFDYLRQQARVADRAGQSFVLSEEHCQEADREFIQYLSPAHLLAGPTQLRASHCRRRPYAPLHELRA